MLGWNVDDLECMLEFYWSLHLRMFQKYCYFTEDFWQEMLILLQPVVSVLSLREAGSINTSGNDLLALSFFSVAFRNSRETEPVCQEENTVFM